MGNQWDTDVKNFSGKINFNDNISVVSAKSNYNKFGGNKNFICDDRKSSSIECNNNNNTIFINSKKKISPKKGIRISAVLRDGSFKNKHKSEENNEVISNTGEKTEEYKLGAYMLDRIQHMTLIPFIVLIVNVFALAGFMESLFHNNDVNNLSLSWEEPRESESSSGSGSGGGSSW